MSQIDAPVFSEYTLRQDARSEPAAILSFVLALSSVAIWILPAVVALFMASGAKRNIEASQGRRKGKGLALAAQIISAITLVVEMLVLGILAFY